MFKVINKDTRKLTLMFFLCCFSVFIVNFEQVNVCLDNCYTAKFFNTFKKFS